MAISKIMRARVFARSGGYCEYCRTHLDYSSSPFCIDHILPVSAGGVDVFENLACACYGCNGHKYANSSAIDPETGLEMPLFHPRTHDWAGHFAWSENYLQLIGLTPIGRATVAGLHLNRPAVINLRRVTLLTGEHPPKI